VSTRYGTLMLCLTFFQCACALIISDHYEYHIHQPHPLHAMVLDNSYQGLNARRSRDLLRQEWFRAGSPATYQSWLLTAARTFNSSDIRAASEPYAPTTCKMPPPPPPAARPLSSPAAKMPPPPPPAAIPPWSPAAKMPPPPPPAARMQPPLSPAAEMPSSKPAGSVHPPWHRPAKMPPPPTDDEMSSSMPAASVQPPLGIAVKMPSSSPVVSARPPWSPAARTTTTVTRATSVELHQVLPLIRVEFSNCLYAHEFLDLDLKQVLAIEIDRCEIAVDNPCVLYIKFTCDRSILSQCDFAEFFLTWTGGSPGARPSR
jgi:hypothetical protein